MCGCSLLCVAGLVPGDHQTNIQPPQYESSWIYGTLTGFPPRPLDSWWTSKGHPLTFHGPRCWKIYPVSPDLIRCASDVWPYYWPWKTVYLIISLSNTIDKNTACFLPRPISEELRFYAQNGGGRGDCSTFTGCTTTASGASVEWEATTAVTFLIHCILCYVALIGFYWYYAMYIVCDVYYL